MSWSKAVRVSASAHPCEGPLQLWQSNQPVPLSQCTKQQHTPPANKARVSQPKDWGWLRRQLTNTKGNPTIRKG